MTRTDPHPYKYFCRTCHIPFSSTQPQTVCPWCTNPLLNPVEVTVA